jgi:Leucine-rich repeat (LRR) protein
MKYPKISWLIIGTIVIVLTVIIFYIRSILIDDMFNNTIDTPDNNIESYNPDSLYRSEFNVKKQKEFYDNLRQTSFKFIPSMEEVESDRGRTKPELVSNAGLSLRRLRVYDEDLEPLLNTPVIWINLENTQITGKAFAILCKIKTLRYLYLSHTKITDDCIPFISQMNNLEVLELCGTDITDKTVVAIVKNCKKLIHLNIAGAKIDGSSLAAFTPDSTLEYLDVSCVKINDKTIENIARMKHLRRVEFAFSEVTDKGLMKFIRNPNIIHIGVECSKVTKRGVMKFIKLRKNVFIRIGMGVEGMDDE